MVEIIFFSISVLARDSISLVVSGKAGPPQAGENLRPLYSGGLCLAVKLMPPAAFLRMISKATAGVGTSLFERKERMPFAERTLTASAANRSDKKRVSYPTTTRFSLI